MEMKQATTPTQNPTSRANPTFRPSIRFKLFIRIISYPIFCVTLCSSASTFDLKMICSETFDRVLFEEIAILVEGHVLIYWDPGIVDHGKSLGISNPAMG